MFFGATPTCRPTTSPFWKISTVGIFLTPYLEANYGYDRDRVGLTFTPGPVPSDATDAERRVYRDSSRVGMSNAGHDYPEALSEPQKRAVLEYLKTL